MTNSIKFSGVGAKFLSNFQAELDIRFYLNRTINLIPVDGGGVIGASTNGHLLGLWFDKDGHVDSETLIKVSPKLSAALGKKSRGIEGDPYLTVIGDHLAAVNEFEEIYVQPKESRTPKSDLPDWMVEARFPDLTPIISGIKKMNFDKGSGLPTCNANYMRLISQSFVKANTSGKFTSIHAGSHKDFPEKIIFVSDSVRNAIAILMSMRVDKPTKLPDFLDGAFVPISKTKREKQSAMA